MKINRLRDLPYFWLYIICLGLVFLSTYLRVIFFNVIGSQTPFLLYLGIILIVSRNLGKGPAFICLALCMLTTDYFFMQPYYALHLDGREAAQLIFFGLEGYLIIMISEQLTKAIKKNHADNSMFSAILENSLDGIVVVNTEGKRTYCSPSVKNIIGFTDQEYLNFPPWLLGHPDELQGIKEKYQRLINEPGKSDIFLHRMKHKNGHWIWVESRVTNLLHEPKVGAMIAHFNDVSQRVESDQLRRDFIGVVSHELKSPLTGIKLYGQLLHKKLGDTDNGISVGFLEKILQQVNHMEKMLADLTDVATIRTGRMQLNIAPFDFNALAYEVAESLQQTTDKHFIQLNLMTSNLISADEERLRQVIVNLVSNAIKYSPDGGDIKISAQEKDSYLMICVQDNGMGIPGRDKDRIFDRLYRVNGQTKGIKGLGLGLYICRQIIQLHGGSIEVDSEEGKGSAFRISLPQLQKQVDYSI
jgi:PAS domain S-box-containing protein